MSATVIIPTTGSPEVRDAINSVLNQSYTTKCYVVVDGEENYVDQSLQLHDRRGECESLQQQFGSAGRASCRCALGGFLQPQFSCEVSGRVSTVSVGAHSEVSQGFSITSR
jgi:hypothetical protein